MTESLRHAVLGAGGVGGLIGACLAKSGAPVTMVVRAESLAKYPERLDLESPFGNFSVPVSRSVDVPGPADVLWIAVKATQLDAALKSITQPESLGRIVPLLNGTEHIALLRERYGADKVIPATIAVESERIAPGHIIHRSSFARLNVASSGQSFLATTVEALQKFGFECRFVDDEAKLMWSKLVFLAAFALTTTAAHKNTGEILADPEWRHAGLSCIREACAVAITEGAQLDAEQSIAGVLKMPGNMRSSMQKDVERGNTPELDAIAGPILRGARKHGIAVPVTSNLVAAVEKRCGRSFGLLK